MSQPTVKNATTGFELRFRSLIHKGSVLAFPCDREGHVDLDSMSDHAKNNYLFARAMVGREYDMPFVGQQLQTTLPQ